MGKYMDRAHEVSASFGAVHPTRTIDESAHTAVVKYDYARQLFKRALDGIKPEAGGPGWDMPSEDINDRMQNMVNLRTEAESAMLDSLADAHSLVYMYAMFAEAFHDLESDRRVHVGRAAVSDETFDEYCKAIAVRREAVSDLLRRYAHAILGLVSDNMTPTNQKMLLNRSASYEEFKPSDPQAMSPIDAYKVLMGGTQKRRGACPCGNPNCSGNSAEALNSGAEALLKMLFGKR